jgi:hypothetical protein
MKRRVGPGDKVWIRMPYSEVNMHMGVAGHRLEVEVKEGGAQLLKDGRQFSSPILHSEAGIFQDERGLYLPDRKLTCDEIFELSESCDGLFVITDPARHMGNTPSLSEVQEHVRECEFCTEVNNDVLGWVA